MLDFTNPRDLFAMVGALAATALGFYLVLRFLALFSKKTQTAEPVTEIDLSPHEWRSDGPRKREPFFGQGWPTVLWWALGGVLGYGLVVLVGGLGR